MMSVEDPLAQACREGKDRALLSERYANLPSIDEIVAGSEKTLFTPYGEQDGNGMDLSLIRSNMQLSVTDRLRQADAARRDVIYVRQHARRIR